MPLMYCRHCGKTASYHNLNTFACPGMPGYIYDPTPKERGAATTQQQPPVPSPSQPAIWDLVIEDMRARDYFGTDKYHTRLQAFNGRDALTDAYQELLDAIAYTKQQLIERARVIYLLNGLLNGLDDDAVHCPALDKQSSARYVVELVLEILKG